MTPFVSIVMPVRNEVRYIEKNLRQILEQDYPAERFEVIIADGDSDDGTRELLDQLAATTGRVRVIDNHARIVPTGLNAAIEESSGEVLIRVDGHVVVERDFVSQSVKALQEHADAWAAGGPIVHRGQSLTGRAIAEAMSHRLGVGNASHRMSDFEGYGEGTAFPAMHRWVFERVGFYDESLVRNQDDEFYFRISQAGGKFYISPRIKYIYFVREKFGQLFRQYYQYSFWRIPVIQKHRQPTTIRQLIPSIFYIAMFALLLIGLYIGKLWISIGLPLVYLTTLLTVGFSRISVVGVRVAARIPIAVVTMHAGYAWGMIYGALCLASGRQAWQQTNQKMVQLTR